MSSHYNYGVIAIYLIAFVTVVTNGLKCYMCGQYNEGVGSITPCFNYSEKYSQLYLKDCTKSSEKYCVKYVSELSTVRDCATECTEKEVWETQTHCCTEDGCNTAAKLDLTSLHRLIATTLLILFLISSVSRH